MTNTKRNNVNFKEMLSDTAEVTNILNCLGLDYLQVQEILSSYQKYNNRFGVIFMVKDNKKEKLQKIIIDAIDGEPNTNQVKELTYDQGADCDKRIVLYTLENPNCKKNEYSHETEIAVGFVTVNNDCGFETFIVDVSLDSEKNLKYAAQIFPDGKRRTSIEKLPTKQECEKAVFKVYYSYTDEVGSDDSCWHECYCDEGLEGWFKGDCGCLDMMSIKFKYPVWNEKGLFAQEDSNPQQAAKELHLYEENNKIYCKNEFLNREVTFETADSGKTSTFIKLWDKPLSFFTNASPANKEVIVEYLRNYDREFYEIWCERRNLDVSNCEKYFSIPENAFDELEMEIVK